MYSRTEKGDYGVSLKHYQHYINGEFVSDKESTTAPLYNPTTGEQTGVVELASEEKIRKAVAAAKAAFPGWASKTPLVRARILDKFRMLIEDHLDELATILSESHGKVFSDAKGEVIRGMEVVEFATGIPHLIKGEHSLNVGTGVDSWSVQQPLGVVAGITPFNFPAMVPMWMYPIALACGNTFILKPSEKDPQVNHLVVELLQEAGLPAGVFNLVHGDKTAVDAILNDPDIQAVSFVGSTPIAEYIYKTGSSYGKRVQALGGAKNHMVIMPDADMEQAANSLMGAAYGSAGERCMAISVGVLVGEETATTMVEKLQEKIQNLKVGPSLAKEPESEMGPLVTQAHYERVKGYINLGVQEGASLVVDGRNFKVTGYEDGFFLGACLFDHVKPNMRIYKEEIFGPVLSLVRVDSYQEATALVNQHEYGNGTAVFTRDGDTARNFCHDIQVGMVGINVPIPVPMAFHSFGGWKRSLFGALHVHGKDGVRFYTRMKTMTSRWPKGIRENQFIMPTMK